MTEVVVPLRVAVDQGFPAICAATGGRADGAISVGLPRSFTHWRSTKVRIPLSEPVFKKWAHRRNIHIKARAFASLFTAIAIVVAFRSATLAVLAIAVAIAVHLVDLWAERTSDAIAPSLERQGTDLVVSGVHERFAVAAQESLQRPMP